jgi:Tol biopolymer transport system component
MLRRSARWILAAVAGTGVLATVPAASAGAGDPASDSSSEIVFDTRYSADVSQIYTVHPDGSGMQQLTHSSKRGSWDPSFSPGGVHIAFVRDGARGAVVVVMDSDGTDPHRVRADTGYDDYAPAFAPDGAGVVFVRCRRAPGYPCRIAQMALDGTHLVQLTHGFWHDGTGPFGSFPGELGPSVNEEDGRIAFGSDRGGYDGRVFVMDADGANLHAVTRPAIGAGDPSWSKEGVWIAVTGDPTFGSTFLLHPDGSDVHRLEAGVLFASFGPTGRWLVGLQESTGTLVTFSADGGSTRPVPGTSGATFTDWAVVS